MSLLDWLNPVKSVADTVVKGATAIFGSKQERDQQNYDLDRGSMDEFAAEFLSTRNNRTWWDSFIDGLNRLPRPVIIGMMMYYLYLSWDNPYYFARINAGLATVPESMWLIIGSIVTFLFGARELFHSRKKDEFKEAASHAKELIKLRSDEPSEIDMEAKYGDLVKDD